MSKRNMTDIIEAYLKNFFKSNNSVEIKRSDVAEQFDCVPSQVNYVINTRFTQAHGYQVESKRGGGGYIRIVKIQLSDRADYLDKMMGLIGQQIDERSAHNLLSTLVKDQVLTEREGRILAELTAQDTLDPLGANSEAIRAYLLNKSFNELRIV